LALLKAEMLYARYRRDGFPLRERIFSSLDLLGRIGCMMPRLANEIIEFAPARKLLEIALGLSPRRSLPHYAGQRFDRWFVKRSSEAAFDKRQINDETVTEGGDHGSRGKVILWDDTFVRYHEPHIGIAAVKVLEALGFDVELARNRKCCGRPAFSQGNLDLAARVGKHNVDLLLSVQGASRSRTPNPPILFLEPSCWSMFVDDYRELKIDHAEKIAPHCFLFEKFVDDLLEREPNALLFANPAALNAPFSGTRDQGKNAAVTIAIHGHCHAKSLLDPSFMARLVERLPGRKAKLLETSCCGMAGSFGYLLDKYELSVEVAGDLIRKIDEARADVVIASGTSCRHQIRDLSNIRTRHMAEIIAEAIAFAGAAGRAAPSWSRS
jgi:Fe-S oxidoreductase